MTLAILIPLFAAVLIVIFISDASIVYHIAKLECYLVKIIELLMEKDTKNGH